MSDTSSPSNGVSIWITGGVFPGVRMTFDVVTDTLSSEVSAPAYNVFSPRTSGTPVAVKLAALTWAGVLFTHTRFADPLIVPVTVTAPVVVLAPLVGLVIVAWANPEAESAIRKNTIFPGTKSVRVVALPADSLSDPPIGRVPLRKTEYGAEPPDQERTTWSAPTPRATVSWISAPTEVGSVTRSAAEEVRSKRRNMGAPSISARNVPLSVESPTTVSDPMASSGCRRKGLPREASHEVLLFER